MSDKDPPEANLRKAYKKLGPAQVNLNQAQTGFRVRATSGPSAPGELDPDLLLTFGHECSAMMAEIVLLKERIILLYEKAGGTWDR